MSKPEHVIRRMFRKYDYVAPGDAEKMALPFCPTEDEIEAGKRRLRAERLGIPDEENEDGKTESE